VVLLDEVWKRGLAEWMAVGLAVAAVDIFVDVGMERYLKKVLCESMPVAGGRCGCRDEGCELPGD